jgi:hypothetical protein
MDIYSLTIFALSAIALSLVIWAFFTGRKLYNVHIVRILIVFLFVSPTFAQEDNITVIGDKPIAFPEGIVEGTEILNNEMKVVVDYLFEDEMWRQSAYMFLYGGNNTTVKLHGPKDVFI